MITTTRGRGSPELQNNLENVYFLQSLKFKIISRKKYLNDDYLERKQKLTSLLQVNHYSYILEFLSIRKYTQYTRHALYLNTLHKTEIETLLADVDMKVESRKQENILILSQLNPFQMTKSSLLELN